MSSTPNRLRLFGLIQSLQQEAAALGLSRTAAALEVTAAVAIEELADAPALSAGTPHREEDDESE